jgi:N-acetylglutamate synthase/N-acetylornithine aminotransferase
MISRSDILHAAYAKENWSSDWDKSYVKINNCFRTVVVENS